MSRISAKTIIAIGLAALAGSAGGYWLAQEQSHSVMPHASAQTGAAPSTRKVLYWYDPMVPQHKFDKPGKSPFMDMQLVPRYADESGDAASISIDPSVTQNLGVRLATVTWGELASRVEAVGVLGYNARDVALVQARAAGFVERVYRLAPGDVLEKGAPLVDLLIPEWAAAQEEFLALRRVGEPALLEGARQRLRLAGMPADVIRQLERSSKVRTQLTIHTPIGGVLQDLAVREGMSISAGAPLASINGLQSVWLEVAVPEAQGRAIRVGQNASARLSALGGEAIEGSVTAVLPEATAASRTLRVRIELPNPDGILRPGLTASVTLADAGTEPVLLIPSEAVIRTGKRALVMVAEPGGRYRPVEVRLGADSGSRTAILQGLEEGQQVVASGQFLIDSEASLRGLTAATLEVPKPALDASSAAPALHASEGRIVELDEQSAKISHGPFHTLGMPGMTMRFAVANPHLLHDVAVEDRVDFAVRETSSGLVIERLQKQEQQQ